LWHLAVVPGSWRARPLLKVNQLLLALTMMTIAAGSPLSGLKSRKSRKKLEREIAVETYI
jgi:hypothetical protein